MDGWAPKDDTTKPTNGRQSSDVQGSSLRLSVSAHYTGGNQKSSHDPLKLMMGIVLTYLWQSCWLQAITQFYQISETLNRRQSTVKGDFCQAASSLSEARTATQDHGLVLVFDYPSTTSISMNFDENDTHQESSLSFIIHTVNSFNLLERHSVTGTHKWLIFCMIRHKDKRQWAWFYRDGTLMLN